MVHASSINTNNAILNVLSGRKKKRFTHITVLEYNFVRGKNFASHQTVSFCCNSLLFLILTITDAELLRTPKLTQHTNHGCSYRNCKPPSPSNINLPHNLQIRSPLPTCHHDCSLTTIPAHPY